MHWQWSHAGHEVHFGPAVRTEDLGEQRSDRSNILRAKCLWVDIDSPDQESSGRGKLQKAEELKNNFIEALNHMVLNRPLSCVQGMGFTFTSYYSVSS